MQQMNITSVLQGSKCCPKNSFSLVDLSQKAQSDHVPTANFSRVVLGKTKLMILLIFGQEEKYYSTIELLKFIEERQIHVLKSMHNMMTLPSLKACMPKCQLSCTQS